MERMFPFAQSKLQVNYFGISGICFFQKTGGYGLVENEIASPSFSEL